MQDGKDETGNDGKSKLNKLEASVVVDIVNKVIKANDVKASDIGVITPYKAQVVYLAASIAGNVLFFGLVFVTL